MNIVFNSFGQSIVIVAVMVMFYAIGRIHGYQKAEDEFDETVEEITNA